MVSVNIKGHYVSFDDIYDSLVTTGHIRERTFKVGSKVHILGSEYMICQVDYAMCCLIGAINGNRYSQPVKVKTPVAITLTEMKLMGYKGE